MSLEGVFKEGFITTSYDSVGELGQNRLFVAYDFWLGLLCGGDDACWRSTL
jgi:hypothetical protein